MEAPKSSSSSSSSSSDYITGEIQLAQYGTRSSIMITKENKIKDIDQLKEFIFNKGRINPDKQNSTDITFNGKIINSDKDLPQLKNKIAIGHTDPIVVTFMPRSSSNSLSSTPSTPSINTSFDEDDTTNTPVEEPETPPPELDVNDEGFYREAGWNESTPERNEEKGEEKGT